MGLSLSNLSDLPGPAKVIVLVASGTAITAVLKIFNVPSQMVWTLVIGMVVVASLVAGVRWLFKHRQKAKSVPFIGKLMGAAGGTPQGLADPAKRARLDDLRKKFQEGVDKFKSAGKDIYGLPWYLIVGPSGSGKSEAIRHCNVGFPPGLQDYLQGAGGTLNMHWWFTNHAVIVDTAGKMFMEEVKAGESSEWKEFLKLLKDSRPLTPINGMLLCIGVDSLIKDSAEVIQENAAKIARQLDVIQRTLDVRFPVFVLVTKCDLITGFREFFENVTDPQLQHQILGWSNPAGLDEPFNPEKVDQHVEMVRQRLLRRRLALIIDPVHTDDPQARRTDQVDAMFALPESMSRLTSRLQSYLGLIFLAGEWSPKPLFLRGIYFTSSMRQGAELDEELAKIMGVPVGDLPGGGVSEEKSYFLRDVFMAKVFREKGLVTRATNVKQQQRGRKVALIGSGIGCVAVLLVATVLSVMNFKKTISEPTEKWKAGASEMDGVTLLTKDRVVGTAYAGDETLDVDGKKSPVGVLELTGVLAGDPPRAPWVLRPFASVSGLLGGDPAKMVREAHAALLERTAVSPLVERARTRMKSADFDAAKWDDNATAVLAALLSIERGAAPPKTPAPEKKRGQSEEPPALRVEWPLDAGKFLEFVLTDPPNLAAAKAEADRLQHVVTWTYENDGGKATWPPAEKMLDRDSIAAAKGVKAFNAYWLGAAVQTRLSDLAPLKPEFEKFVETESALAAAVKEFQARNSFTRDSYAQFKQRWDERYAALAAAYQKVDARLKKPGFDAKRLADEIKRAEESLRFEAEDAYRIVLGDAPSSASDAIKALSGDKGKKVEGALDKVGLDLDKPKPWRAEAEDLHQELLAARTTVLGPGGIQAKVAVLREYFTTGDGDKLLKRPADLYAATARFQAYEQANKALALETGKRAWGELASGCKQDKDKVAELLGEVRKRAIGFDAASLPMLTTAAGGDFEFLMGTATRDARARAVRAVTDVSAADPGWVKVAISRLAADTARTTTVGSIGGKYAGPIVIQLTASGDKGITIDPAYHPDAARELFRDLECLAGFYGSTPRTEDQQIIEDPGLSGRASSAMTEIASYAVEYSQHWTTGKLDRLDVADSSTWAEFKGSLATLSGGEDLTGASLRRLGDLMVEALSIDGLAVAVGKARAEVIAQWVGKIRAEQTTFDINKRLREDRELWSGLGPTGADVRSALGNQTAEAFPTRYLQGFACETTTSSAVCGPATRYLDLIRLRALKSLGNELETARQKFIADLPRNMLLPVLMEAAPDHGSGPVVAPEKVREFSALISVGQRDTTGRGELIIQGGQTRLPCVNEQLDRIFGKKGFGTQERLCNSLSTWLPWLLSDATFELQVMPDTADGLAKKAPRLEAQNITNAQGVFRRVEVSLGTASKARTDNDQEQSLLAGIPLPLRAPERLKIAFSETSDGAGRQGVRPLPSVWSVLELFAEPDAEPYSPGTIAGAPDGPAPMWRVPVVFSPLKDGKPEVVDGRPVRHYLWLVVRFTSPVPGRATWPTKEKWGQ